jgi:hypothetical protein
MNVLNYLNPIIFSVLNQIRKNVTTEKNKAIFFYIDNINI